MLERVLLSVALEVQSSLFGMGPGRSLFHDFRCNCTLCILITTLFLLRITSLRRGLGPERTSKAHGPKAWSLAVGVTGAQWKLRGGV